MKLRVQHRTEYLYTTTVRSNSNETRLQPPLTPWQTRGFFLLKVLPSTRLKHYQDFHRNGVQHFEIAEPHTRLVIEAQATVTTLPRGQEALDAAPVSFMTLASCREMEEIAFYTGHSRYVRFSPVIWKTALDLRNDSDDLFRTVQTINHFVYDNCRYLPGVTTVETTSQDFFETRTGVCQDFAHLMLALCRSLGIPSRYVSGYLYDATRSGLRGAHQSHAWIETYLPGLGWVGFDPTNRQLVSECYITLAVGRDYEDAAPVKGSYVGAGTRTMNVTVTIDRIGD
jgi:transglutaminase-like putative cysteine protease